jgi:hypothetical protein
MKRSKRKEARKEGEKKKDKKHYQKFCAVSHAQEIQTKKAPFFPNLCQLRRYINQPIPSPISRPILVRA